jgi:4-hydroxy-tetrahydrodipicolinate synthase
MKFPGVTVAILTPFTSEKGINEEALRQITNYLVEAGVSGVLTGGSSGEVPFQSIEERIEAINVVMNEVGGKVNVIMGTTSIRTEDAVKLTEYAKNIGVDAVMAMPSYFYSHSEQELHAYYDAIASIGLPVIIFNAPKTSGEDVTSEIALKLAKNIENVKYIKESSGDILRIQKILQLGKGILEPFIGHDYLAYEAFMLGVKGWITGAGNVIPSEMVKFYDLAVRKKDYDQAKELYFQMLPFFNLVRESKGKYVQYFKEGIKLISGIDMGNPRKPLLPLNDEEKKMLNKCLTRIRKIQ